MERCSAPESTLDCSLGSASACQSLAANIVLDLEATEFFDKKRPATTNKRPDPSTLTEPARWTGIFLAKNKSYVIITFKQLHALNVHLFCRVWPQCGPLRLFCLFRVLVLFSLVWRVHLYGYRVLLLVQWSVAFSREEGSPHWIFTFEIKWTPPSSCTTTVAIFSLRNLWYFLSRCISWSNNRSST